MPIIKGEYRLRFNGERRVFLNGDPAHPVRVIIGDAFDLEDNSQVTIKGESGERVLKPGMVYRFWGRWIEHHKYGNQFHFQSFVEDMPADREAIIAYIASQKIKGLGLGLAAKIFAAFGDKSIPELIEHPDAVAEKIPRLSAETAIAAAEILRKQERTRLTKVDLIGLLYGRGFQKTLPDKLLRDWGAEAAERVKADPYLLMNYRGCGFLKADRLYIELGHDPTAMRRQALCCWYAIASGRDGHTWYPQAVARDSLARQIAGSDVHFEEAIECAIADGLLSDKFEIGTRWLAEDKKSRAEWEIARRVVNSEQEAAGTGTSWPSLDQLEGLTEHQCAQAKLALNGFIGVLGGSPGTGKTYTSARIIKAILDAYGPEQVAICAPTGKAAVRVGEAMHANHIEHPATTIHSLLGVMAADDGEGWSFQYDERNPFRLQFIIVDESSMIDTFLMSALLRARPKGCHILFVGDVNQLAPVGHGAPLRDLIAAGVPYGELTEILRNSGRVVKACSEIRDYRRFSPSPAALDLPNGENLVMAECQESDEQIESLRQMLEQFMTAKPRKYDPIWDIQVLVPVNKKSPIARKPLNKLLQELLNFNGERVDGNPFRVGDKIINTKNGSVPKFQGDRQQAAPVAAVPFDIGNLAEDLGELPEEDDREERDGKSPDEGKVYVANGEQAEVIAVEPNKTIARMQSPDRLILIPRGVADKPEENEEAKVEGEEETGTSEDESTGTGCNWELAYAISGHKSQGSEWPIAIILADEANAARRVQSRNWIYTAISRAKKACFILGKRQVVEDSVRRDGLWRKTFLAESIKELRGSGFIIADVPHRSPDELAKIGRETGICQFCSRELDNPTSLHYGYGPVCAKNYGLPYSATIENKQQQNDFFSNILEGVF